MSGELVRELQRGTPVGSLPSALLCLSLWSTQNMSACSSCMVVLCRLESQYRGELHVGTSASASTCAGATAADKAAQGKNLTYTRL